MYGSSEYSQTLRGSKVSVWAVKAVKKAGEFLKNAFCF